MCDDCFKSFGRPKVRSPLVFDLRDKIARVYEMDDMGGHLHCELNDWNIDDRFFEREDLEVWDGDATPERIAAERDCYAAMRRATLAERASALGLYDGFWSTDAAKREEAP